MNTEEINWWVKYLGERNFAEAEIEYAFGKWLENRKEEEWWPTAGRIRELCEAYRVSERQKLLPVGCERCDWTGFYMTKASRTIEGNENREARELAAECPCRADASLRTPCVKRKATEAELRVMWTLVWEMCQEKGKQAEKAGLGTREKKSMTTPTMKELAEQLTRDQERAKNAAKPSLEQEIERYRRRMEEGE